MPLEASLPSARRPAPPVAGRCAPPDRERVLHWEAAGPLDRGVGLLWRTSCERSLLGLRGGRATLRAMPAIRRHLGTIATAIHRAPATVSGARRVHEKQKALRIRALANRVRLVAGQERDGVAGQ